MLGNQVLQINVNQNGEVTKNISNQIELRNLPDHKIVEAFQERGLWGNSIVYNNLTVKHEDELIKNL